MREEHLFEKAIDYFNNGYFFEAHDTFEELWIDDRDGSKKFFQGLVQLSTGFYHLMMKNLKGAESQLSKGIEKLERYEPEYERIELTSLLGNVRICLEKIRNRRSDVEDMAALTELIPQIRRDAD